MKEYKMVTYSVFELKDNKKLVMVRYKDVVDSPLAEGLTAAELVAKANEVIAEESGAEQLPEVAEVKSIKTRVCKVPAEASEESGSESGSSEKYAIVASVRYVSEAEESESL